MDCAASEEVAGGVEAGHEEVLTQSGGEAAGTGVPDHVSQVVGVLQSIVIGIGNHVEVGHQLLEAVAWQA